MTIGEDERVSLQAVAEMHNITVDPFKFSMSKFFFSISDFRLTVYLLIVKLNTLFNYKTHKIVWSRYVALINRFP